MRVAPIAAVTGAAAAVLTLGLTVAALEAGGAVRLPAHQPAAAPARCAVASPRTPSAEAALFRALPGAQWGGADLSVSTALPDGRAVWIYGDTLSGQDSARLTGFVHSSAIVQQHGCLHVSRGGAQLLPDVAGGTYAWPTGAVPLDGNRLLVSAALVRTTGSCPFCFEQVGTRGAIVAVDPAGDVSFTAWTPSWVPWDGDIMWGTGLTEDGGRFAMYGLSPTGLSRNLFVATASRADALAGRWRLSRTPIAHGIDPGGVSAYRDGTGWHVVTVRGTAVLRLDAAGPSGPFTETTIGALPASDGHGVYYAAAAHPELQMASGGLLVTVCRNYIDGAVRPLRDYQPLYLTAG
jgi:hypothetical protein